MKRLLILGLDPGTTLGYALLDIHGTVVLCDQEKNVTHASIIKRCVEQGRVVLVGTDKAKVPDTVKTIAVSLGAQVVAPDRDLTLLEKKIDEKRPHARDALASAQFAFKKIQSLMDRVTAKSIPERFHEEVLLLVLQHNYAIDSAYQILKHVPPEPVAQAVAKKQERSPKWMMRIANTLSRNESIIKKQKKHIQKLQKRVKKLERDVRQTYKRYEQTLNKKPKSNAHLLEEEQQAHAQTKKSMRRLKSLVLQGKTVMPCVPHLGEAAKEFLKQETWLFVENPNEMSQSVVESASILGIVYVHQPSTRAKQAFHFPCVAAEKINFIREEDLVFVERGVLINAIASDNLLSEMVEKYQSQRKQGLNS